VVCEGVEFRIDGIWSIEVGAMKKLIPADEIQHISLRRGVEAPRPLVQTAVGVVIFGFGCTPFLNISRFMEWSRHQFVPVYDALVLPLVILGVWLVYRAWRRGVFLEVQTPSSSRRVFFVRQPSTSSAVKALSEAGHRFGYSVEVQ
jgi:hypothetical protein